MKSRDHTCRFKMSGRSRGGSGSTGLELLTDCSIDCKKFKKTADSVLKSITEVSADVAVSRLVYNIPTVSLESSAVEFTSRMGWTRI